MSLLLYHGDYIVVQGEISEHQYIGHPEKTSSYSVCLTFILQNNGKQRLITETFPIVKNDKGDFELENWHWWNVLVNILVSLQYSLSDEPHNQYQCNHIIKEWIARLARLVEPVCWEWVEPKESN